jgi:hypothetical protein
MKIVHFKDGTYGVRRLRLWGYEFLDEDGTYWWAETSNVIRHAHITSKEKAMLLAKERGERDNGRVVLDK